MQQRLAWFEWRSSPYHVGLVCVVCTATILPLDACLLLGPSDFFSSDCHAGCHLWVAGASGTTAGRVPAVHSRGCSGVPSPEAAQSSCCPVLAAQPAQPAALAVTGQRIPIQHAPGPSADACQYDQQSARRGMECLPKLQQLAQHAGSW